MPSCCRLNDACMQLIHHCTSRHAEPHQSDASKPQPTCTWLFTYAAHHGNVISCMLAKRLYRVLHHLHSTWCTSQAHREKVRQLVFFVRGAHGTPARTTSSHATNTPSTCTPSRHGRAISIPGAARPSFNFDFSKRAAAAPMEHATLRHGRTQKEASMRLRPWATA